MKKRGTSNVYEMNKYYEKNGWCVEVVANEEGHYQTITLPPKTRDRRFEVWGTPTGSVEYVCNSDNSISYLHRCKECNTLMYLNRRSVISNPNAKRYHVGVGCPNCKEEDKIPQEALMNSKAFEALLIEEGVWTNFKITKFVGTGRMARVGLECLNCGTTTEAEAYSFTGCHRHACQGCNGSIITKIEFEKRMKSERPDLKIIGEFVGASQELTFVCGCGKEFSRTPSQVLSGCQCPECGVKTESLMAQQVKKYCQNRFESVEDREKVWDIEGRKLRSDVWIEEIGLWIEVHGQQHYTESGLYSKNFEDLVNRDNMKIEHCKKNGYNYIAFNQPLLQKHPRVWAKFLRVAIEKCKRGEKVFWVGADFDSTCKSLTLK